MGNLATAVGTTAAASDSDTSGSVRKTVRLDNNQGRVRVVIVNSSLILQKLDQIKRLY